MQLCHLFSLCHRRTNGDSFSHAVSWVTVGTTIKFESGQQIAKLVGVHIQQRELYGLTIKFRVWGEGVFLSSKATYTGIHFFSLTERFPKELVALLRHPTDFVNSGFGHGTSCWDPCAGRFSLSNTFSPSDGSVAQWVASFFPFLGEGFPLKVNQPPKKKDGCPFFSPWKSTSEIFVLCGQLGRELSEMDPQAAPFRWSPWRRGKRWRPADESMSRRGPRFLLKLPREHPPKSQPCQGKKHTRTGVFPLKKHTVFVPLGFSILTLVAQLDFCSVFLLVGLRTARGDSNLGVVHSATHESAFRPPFCQWAVAAGERGLDPGVLATTLAVLATPHQGSSRKRTLFRFPLSRSPSGALLPFFGGEGSPKIDYRKKGALILTSLLEDPV